MTLRYSGIENEIQSITSPKNRKLERDLILQVLTVNKTSPNINYKYTISKEHAPRYSWRVLDDRWSDCTSICTGTQHLVPVCVDMVTQYPVDESFCSDLPRSTPMRKRECNRHCKLIWNATKNDHCSVHCGKG